MNLPQVFLQFSGVASDPVKTKDSKEGRKDGGQMDVWLAT